MRVVSWHGHVDEPGHSERRGPLGIAYRRRTRHGTRILDIESVPFVVETAVVDVAELVTKPMVVAL